MIWREKSPDRKLSRFQQCALCHARSSGGRKWEVIFVYMILRRRAGTTRGRRQPRAAFRHVVESELWLELATENYVDVGQVIWQGCKMAFASDIGSLLCSRTRDTFIKYPKYFDWSKFWGVLGYFYHWVSLVCNFALLKHFFCTNLRFFSIWIWDIIWFGL